MRLILLQYPKRRIVPSALATFCMTVGIGLLSAPAMQADELYRFQSGLQLSSEAPLTGRQIHSLLKGLKTCTGFDDLKIDDTGLFKVIDRTRLNGGSINARRLLVAAIDGNDSFILEGVSHSSTIAFAEIEQTDVYVDSSNLRHSVWRIRLDFSDFNDLRGPEKAVMSFGPPLVLFHELGHGVFHLSDALGREDPLGACERFVNLIRNELGLPERENYRPRGWRAVSPGNTAESLQGEFSFSLPDQSTQRPKTYYLAFDVDRVCDVLKLQSLPPGRAEVFIASR
jgi:hypothetical protein